MRFIKYILTTLLLLVVNLTAMAQMEFSDLTASDNRPYVNFADSIRIQQINSVDYFSLPQYRYQRHLLRQERNKIEITSNLQGSLTNLNDAWIETSGGDNSITLLASIYLKHTFKKNLFSLQTIMSAKFGYYRVMLEEELDDGTIENNPIWYKNQDEFQVEVTPSIQMSKNWSYGASIKFRSQFAEGYVSSSSQESYNLKSDFMSPGYLDLSGGLIYKCPSTKFPINITLSPLAMSATYVKNAEVRLNAQYSYTAHTNTESYTKAYGVAPNSSSKYEGGSSLQLYFDRKFGKNDYFQYTTTLYSFYGWMSQITTKNVYSDVAEFNAAMDVWEADYEGNEPMLSIHPTVRWENKITIKASKMISTTLNFQLYYNRAQSLSVQTQTLLSVGLSYTFSNK